MSRPGAPTKCVMAGHSASEDARRRAYVPAIHAFPARKMWIPGTRPGMTSYLFAFGFLLVLSLSALAALTFPQLTGRVVDDAGILDAATKANLDRKLADFESKTTGQLVVVTLKSLQGTSIEDYGYQLGRHWGIGQKGKNSGALLIVAPNQRQVRIEVGYGLEGALTDAVSKLIIENAILPRFKAGDFAGGITRGVDDIIQVLSGDAEEWKARASKRPDTQLTTSQILLLIFFVL